MGLREYLLRVKNLDDDIPEEKAQLDAMGYDPDDKDSGYRSWLRLYGHEQCDEHLEIFREVVYPFEWAKEIKKAVEEKQLQLQF